MITVIGAGPSGLTASIKLAESGKKVTIYEKNDFIGKESGDNIQAIRNYNLPYDQLQNFNERGIKINYTKPINRIIKYAPSGRKMEVISEDGPLFYALKRGSSSYSLDSQLYNNAIENNVKIIFNKRKSLKSADVIAVTSLYKNIWAYGAVFKGVTVNPETILFFMDNRYCLKGYIYLIPYGKHEISIAATSFDLSCALPVLFEKFIKENEIVNKIIDGASFSNFFSGYAYSNLPKTAEINRKKFVGASAGFVDFARGFGNRYAIESALLAADAIINKKSYDSLWKNAFEKELSESFMRRMLLEQLTNADYEKLILGEKISIKKYEKIPSALKGVLFKVKLSLVLKEWQQKYDLKKLFN